MREHIRILVGDYASTRVVEQIASEYSTCIWNPEDIDALLLERKKDFVGNFRPRPEPWLLIFKIDGDTAAGPPNTIRTLLMNGRHWCVDLLFLDAHAQRRWNPMERAQLDAILFFPSTRPRYHRDLLRQYISPTATDLDELARQLDAILFGRCFVFDSHAALTLWRPWHKLWTPESHSTFPSSVRERVRLLLLAQRDAGSLLSRLDKACLMEILLCGAALDGPLVLRGMAVVFTSASREKHWRHKGVPAVFIHTYTPTFEEIYQNLSHRQKFLRQASQRVEPVNVILDGITFKPDHDPLICIYDTSVADIDCIILPKEAMDFSKRVTNVK